MNRSFLAYPGECFWKGLALISRLSKEDALASVGGHEAGS